MNKIQVKKISLTIHGNTGRTHIEFHDQFDTKRFGRILPIDIDISNLEKLYSFVSKSKNLIVPDGISTLSDGCKCISFKSEEFPALKKQVSLKQLLKSVEALHESGMNHLSVDEHSLRIVNNKIHLVFWGDGLLTVYTDTPYEVQAGGIPHHISDLYMLSATALRMNWLSSDSEIKDAIQLSGDSILKRWKTATKYNCHPPVQIDNRSVTIQPGINIIQGGAWEKRDICVNQMTAIAASKGWMCRVIRCTAEEINRPLPDMPLGTFTNNPDGFLRNIFGKAGGIEKLIIINDFSELQRDLLALVQNISKLKPSGIRLVLCGASIPESIQGTRYTLNEPSTNAIDLPINNSSSVLKCTSSGPSWFGPRCRVSKNSNFKLNELNISDELLFKEGAWRYISSLPFKKGNDSKAISLHKLGKNKEALKAVGMNNKVLRAKILIELGRFNEAVNLLTDTEETVLLSKAYLGHGNIQKALEIIKNTKNPDALSLFAKLHNLAGTARAALIPLLTYVNNTTEKDKINIYCALRSTEMRLGMYDDALNHAEIAVNSARQLSDIPLLVKSLQARGRTLQVSGNWSEALQDYRTAVQFYDDNLLSNSRPPHIDLYVLQLKMGRICVAEETRKRFSQQLINHGVLGKQMLYMLQANTGALLGRGEHSLSFALKAEQLANTHGLELYSGISTLYAGQLYIQNKEFQVGYNLLKKARAKGHMIGDKHLVCLAEIELLLEEKSYILTETEISKIAINLPEEHATIQIISGTDREKGFKLLLELPSPLLACRLADKCGLPENLILREKIITWKDDILKQLNSQDKHSFNKLFTSKWNVLNENESSLLINKHSLGVISSWIQQFLEDVALLPELANSLELEEICLSKQPGMVQVPGDNPLFCSGVNANKIAPLLEPVAAVVAVKPAAAIKTTGSNKLSKLIVGNSKGIEKVRHEILRVAQENVSVLVTGETGTGKELCARAIHNNSLRKLYNFVPVDCGAIPEHLMESEFFGAGVGAYTGSTNPRKGLLEEADSGTLFLDEVGNLPIHMQAKLLRVLDTGIYRRLGETKERSTSIRLITATNANIENQIAEGLFRSDLYYRISIIHINLPPLRKRLEDIPLLIPLFTQKSISKAALELLYTHGWAGNIRELSNVLKRAAIISPQKTIQKSHISFNKISNSNNKTCTLHQAIIKHIKDTVESFGGNRTQAAKALQCDPKTLRKYLN